MYIHDWDEFYDTASKLYNNNSKVAVAVTLALSSLTHCY